MYSFIYLNTPKPLAFLLSGWCPDFPQSHNHDCVHLSWSMRSTLIIEKKYKKANKSIPGKFCLFFFIKFLYSFHSFLFFMHYLIGIDEAGRGPWAWPIVVWGYMIAENYRENLFSLLPGLVDSKKISSEKRESLFYAIEQMQERWICQYAFSYRDAYRIDQIGIRESNRQCMQDVILSLLPFLQNSDTVQIMIDGCDNFSFDISGFSYFFAQKKNKKSVIYPTLYDKKNPAIQSVSYVIGWDGVVPVISAGSIIAKVLRDRMMCEYSVDFPEYKFSLHKGYGTALHREKLHEFWPTPIHRKSYAPVKKLIFPNSSI